TGRDLRERDVGARDVHLAGHHAERAVGIEPYGRTGRLQAAQPASERESGAAQLAGRRALLPFVVLFPRWVLGEALENLIPAVAGPRLVVRHRVALSLEMA